MNPNLCRVALRPRGPLEVFDLGMVFVRARIGPILRMTAIVVLPPLILAFPLCWFFAGHPALIAYPLVLAPVLQAPFTVLAGRLLFAEDVGVSEVLLDVLRRLPALIGAWALGLLGWAITALSCFVGLLVAQPALLYLTEAALLERVGPRRGLSRTLRLAGGHVGTALVGAVARFALAVWFLAVGEAFGQAAVGFVLQLGTPFGTVQDGLVTPYLIGGLLLAQPFVAIYRLLLYVDVRTRLEGWDLQVGLRAAGLA